MNFASDLAYLSDDDLSGHESVDEEELEAELNEDDDRASEELHEAAAQPSGSSFSLNSLFGGFGSTRGGSRSVGGGRRDRRAMPTAPTPPPFQDATMQAAPQLASQAATAVPPEPRRQQRQRYHRKIDTNVMNISLGTITSTATIATGEAQTCEGCGACASALSKLTKVEMPDIGTEMYEWNCEFCGHSQTLELDAEELPGTESTVDFILEPAVSNATGAATGAAAGGGGGSSKEMDGSGLVLFVVDTSGSMCVTSEVPGSVKLKGDKATENQALRREHGGDNNQYLPGQRRDVTYVSRMQAVQAAINAQIEEMAADTSTKTKVGLITFSNEVTIFGDGTGAPVIVAGDRLQDLEALLGAGRDARAGMGLDVSESAQSLSEALFALEESGPTALGPAVAVALGMAAGSKGASSRVVLCTDGLANIGVGSLDEIPEGANPIRTAAEQFYASLGEAAVTAGTVVDVISIVGQDADLENLGAMSEATGGTVTRVDPIGLQQDFAGILHNPVVATNVSVKVLLHAGMQFREQGEARAAVPSPAPDAPTPARAQDAEAGAAAAGGAEAGSASAAEDAASAGGGGGGGTPALMSVMQKLVGNATADSEMSIEYQVKPKAERQKIGVDMDLEELPFQVQITYTNLKGDVCLRVISQNRPVTREKAVAERAAKVEMLMAHNMQHTGRLAGEGDYVTARVSNRAYGKLLKRCAKTEEDAAKTKVWRHNAGMLDRELNTELKMTADMALDELSEQCQVLEATASTFRAGAKTKSARKAARSRNDNLSHHIYAAKQQSSKKMALW